MGGRLQLPSLSCLTDASTTREAAVSGALPLLAEIATAYESSV